MSLPDPSAPQSGLPRFVRVAGVIWLVVVLALLLGALLAPHIGRVADAFLHRTWHRDWVRIRLQTEEPFFDVSTPIHSVRSYYSALYRGDAAHMEVLTEEPLRQHMRQRLRHHEASTAGTAYRSYLRIEHQDKDHAVVIEKFHLFWQRGQRFYLQRDGTTWRIRRIGLLTSGMSLREYVDTPVVVVSDTGAGLHESPGIPVVPAILLRY